MELDREEKALRQNPFGGLGFDGDGQRTDYGGKVNFYGQIDMFGGKLGVKLVPPEIGPSCRIKQRFGSSNFLQLKSSSEVKKNHNAHLKLLVQNAAVRNLWPRLPPILCKGPKYLFATNQRNLRRFLYLHLLPF